MNRAAEYSRTISKTEDFNGNIRAVLPNGEPLIALRQFDVRLHYRHHARFRRANPVIDYFSGSIRVTVSVPPTLSAAKRTLSPSFTLSSIAGSCTRNAIVMPGISRFGIASCLSVILPTSLSTFRTSPLTIVTAAAGCACTSMNGESDGDAAAEIADASDNAPAANSK